jgi:uncharacterized protein YihD (DUF1040 family)
MNEFKEQLNQAFDKVAKLSEEWEKLDDHEIQTIQQVVEETGFDELGNFEEVVDKFKQFYLQMQRTTVIDGYQVWIDDSKRLHIIVNNTEWILTDLAELKTASKYDYPSRVEKPTLMKIISWYIDTI